MTNNAARPPATVAEHLREFGIQADDADVVTSAQAAAHLLVERFGEGARVLVVGGAGILAALTERKLTPVHSADENPVAVIQGWAVDLTWEQLNEAAIAIHRGAHWVATNIDPTRPTDRGLVPGNGAAVAAVRMAVTSQPEVAGKPFRPLLDETTTRLGATGRSSSAIGWTPISRELRSPGWTACWCSPARIAAEISWLRNPQNARRIWVEI